MVSPLKRRNPSDRWRIILGAAVGAVLSLLLVLAAFFGRGVVYDLQRLKSASSDNVQWMLSQVEVEFLAFTGALDFRDGDGLADLILIREKYDVIYSRVETLHSSPMFRGLAQGPEYQLSLAQLRQFIFQALPLVDASDDSLQVAVPELSARAAATRPSVRALSVSGLSYFARESDLRRGEMAQTLLNLALVSVVLLLALTTLSVYLWRANRKARQRGIMLAQANQRMNTVLSTSLDAIIVTKASGELLEFNQAAEHIFQRKFDEVKGKLVEEVIVPPRLRNVHRKGLEQLNGGVERWILGKEHVRTQGLRADGTVFPMELTWQSASYGSEQILVGFLRDISQRVSDEKELIEARDRALDGEKAKADFLTLMSHEIRTPLNGILGNLSLLDHSELTGEQRQNIRNMKISGGVLMGHVDSVLDIAMFEGGKVTIASEPVHLGALLQDLIDGQSGSAKAQGLEIEWKWVGAPQDWVISDTKRLHQLLLNLVGNAIKFTEHGGVVIEAEADWTAFDDTPDKTSVEFRIIDTGVGIAQVDIERLFEDFQTNDATFGRLAGGTGLGLGIARRMARAMGGEITVGSVVGQGSCFAVRLPFSLVERPVLHAVNAGNRTPQPGLEILVVEDNEINLELIRNMLERDGHKVSLATNGRSGVAKAQERRYDFIFMDISMPIMDGIQATRLIRKEPGPSADSPIVAVSANVLPQDRQRFLDAGMNASLSKPLTIERLRRHLNAFRNGGAPEFAARLADTPEQVRLDEMREILGQDVFPRLLAQLVSESEELIQVLHQNGQAQTPMPELAAHIHKVAGSAAVFGATHFRQALLELEKAALAEDAAALSKLSKQLGHVWHQTHAELTF